VASTDDALVLIHPSIFALSCMKENGHHSKKRRRRSSK
jgi:hypothetical protein